ncbi:amidase [Nocardia australiensis]|uniref:amidase n=1 Tax=Nocardia australiensis TaxID=2887191 RepID=UPI001D134DA8|nr:amidase [Nocardia australiensis]
MSSAYWTQPIRDQTTVVRDGSISAESLVMQVRGEIERREPDLAAWVELSSDYLDDARARGAATPDLPLRGVSLGVKDLIDVAGLPTRAGSPVTSERPAMRDAACVARFRDLGAVVQGKTVTTEFGYFSPGPTHNPHASGYTPGGSSSGSAAAVGAGTIPVALGTQTAGSLTRPASYCGAAGLVFAHGTTDLTGVTGLSDSLDTLGILTRTIDDLRYVYGAFTGERPVGSTDGCVETILLWDGSTLDHIQPAMLRLLDLLPELLQQAGFTPEKLEWDDHIRTLADDHLTVMAYEAARTLGPVLDQSGHLLSGQLRALLEDGRAVGTGMYASALIRRDRSRALFSEMLTGNTVVIGPAALGAAPQGLHATGSPILSRPWQLLGAPVVVVPGARTNAGLPLGLQLMALPGHETRLFEVATLLEPMLRALPALPA